MTPKTTAEFIAEARVICEKATPVLDLDNYDCRLILVLTRKAEIAALNRLEAAEKELAESREEARELAQWFVALRPGTGLPDRDLECDSLARRILARAEKDGGEK